MYKAIRIILFSCLANANTVLAQKDARDCQDPAPFARPEHYVIESCDSHYGTYRFRVKPGQAAQPLIGNASTFRYTADATMAKPLASMTQLLSHYEQVVLNNKGRVIYSDGDEGSFTMIKDGKEYWLSISEIKPSGAKTPIGAYTLTLLEKKVPQIRKQVK